jgi:hypothetical protein
MFYLDSGLYEALRQAAFHQRVTMTAILSKALEAELIRQRTAIKSKSKAK